MRAALLALLLVALTGCGAPSPDGRNLGSWARTVSNLRESADRYLREGKPQRAEAELRRIFELPVPAGDPRTQTLLQDAHFALGSVLLLTGRPEEAIVEADRGLTRSDAATVFRANLLALRAMATEAAGRPLDALDDYQRAIEIHKSLFDAELAAKGNAE